jgi:hypothetical protein
MVSPTTDKVIKQLRKASLSMADRVALTNVLLDKLGAFPIGDIVRFTENHIEINGRNLDTEQYLAFKEAASAMKENFARRVINEQLKYKATEMGIHKAVSLDELFFSKAIIWFINEENILLEKISTL